MLLRREALRALVMVREAQYVPSEIRERGVVMLSDLSIGAIVRTTMQVFADAYRERPAFVAIWIL